MKYVCAHSPCQLTAVSGAFLSAKINWWWDLISIILCCIVLKLTCSWSFDGTAFSKKKGEQRRQSSFFMLLLFRQSCFFVSCNLFDCTRVHETQSRWNFTSDAYWSHNNQKIMILLLNSLFCFHHLEFSHNNYLFIYYLSYAFQAGSRDKLFCSINYGLFALTLGKNGFKIWLQ